MGKTKTKSRSVGDSPKPPITIRSTNPKVIDDNIAKLEKAIQASDVSANPSGTAEETLLSSIGIDGKKYDLGPSAENTSYDNTDSGLTATEAQAAIDELATGLSGKISLGETTVYTKSSEVTGGNYPTGQNFFAIIVQTGGNGAVTTNLLNSAYLNKRVYVDGTHFAYFNNSGVFSMSDLSDGDLVAIIPIN